MSPVVMVEFWDGLYLSERRALSQLAHAFELDRQLALITYVPWSEIPASERKQLIRAMRELGELAVRCASTLERAREVMERGS